MPYVDANVFSWRILHGAQDLTVKCFKCLVISHIEEIFMCIFLGNCGTAEWNHWMWRGYWAWCEETHEASTHWTSTATFVNTECCLPAEWRRLFAGQQPLIFHHFNFWQSQIIVFQLLTYWSIILDQIRGMGFGHCASTQGFHGKHLISSIWLERVHSGLFASYGAWANMPNTNLLRTLYGNRAACLLILVLNEFYWLGLPLNPNPAVSGSLVLDPHDPASFCLHPSVNTSHSFTLFSIIVIALRCHSRHLHHLHHLYPAANQGHCREPLVAAFFLTPVSLGCILIACLLSQKPMYVCPCMFMRVCVHVCAAL